MPWFIEKKYRESFSKWNHHTRVAYIWRTLTEKGLKFASENKKFVMQFKLEDFMENPEIFVDEIERFVGQKSTGLTAKHIDSVKSHKNRVYPDNTQFIEESERKKFIELRQKLGYAN